MVKSSSTGLESARLTHHRNVSMPVGTLDNATLGSETFARSYILLKIAQQ